MMVSSLQALIEGGGDVRDFGGSRQTRSVRGDGNKVILPPPVSYFLTSEAFPITTCEVVI